MTMNKIYNVVDYTNSTYIHILHDNWMMNHPKTGSLDSVEILDIEADCKFDETNRYRLDEILRHISYGNYTFALYRMAAFEDQITIALKSGALLRFDVSQQSWLLAN